MIEINTVYTYFLCIFSRPLLTNHPKNEITVTVIPNHLCQNKVSVSYPPCKDNNQPIETAPIEESPPQNKVILMAGSKRFLNLVLFIAISCRMAAIIKIPIGK